MPGNHIFFFFFIMASGNLFAQQGPVTSKNNLDAETFLVRYYEAQRKNESPLYNGRFSYAYPPDIEGVPYYLSKEWQNGSVVYDHIHYENILMKYDEVKDLLIIKTKLTGGQDISLFSPRVASFSFSGIEFVYMQKEKTGTVIQDGFYRLLVKGTATAFAKTTKTIKEEIVSNTVKREFISKTRYFIVKDGQYYAINKKDDLLTIFKDHKKEVQDVLSKRKLKFRKDTETSIKAATEQYNQLKN